MSVNTKYWVLASPYSKYRGGCDAAYKLAARNRALLVRAGIRCFSPICHSHGPSVEGNIDGRDLEIWLASEEPFRVLSSGMIVLCAPGWRESDGIAVEMTEFRIARKPLIYMAPDQVPVDLIDAVTGGYDAFEYIMRMDNPPEPPR